MSKDSPASSGPLHSSRRRVLTPLHFVLRGLAISLPSVLTVVILLWLARGINTYIVYPATSAVKWVLAQGLDESIPVGNVVKLPGGPPLEQAGNNYRVTPELQSAYFTEVSRRSAPAAAEGAQEPLASWLAREPGVYVPFDERAVPYEHYLAVARAVHPQDMARSTTGLYMDYAAEQYFGRLFHLSLAAIVLIVIGLYFLGRFVTARVGHWLVTRFETAVLGRLPLVRNVYGSIKQVTDFLFSEKQVEFRRVVAIEYPRRGIWSLGFVTGESMLDITTVAGEPCVNVLVPNSPVPMTGYTMCLPRSHVLDLDLTVEQAMSFSISCGVLVPAHQRVTPELLRQHLEKRFAEGFQSSATNRQRPPRVDGSGHAAASEAAASDSGVNHPPPTFRAHDGGEAAPSSPDR